MLKVLKETKQYDFNDSSDCDSEIESDSDEELSCTEQEDLYLQYVNDKFSWNVKNSSEEQKINHIAYLSKVIQRQKLEIREHTKMILDLCIKS